MPVELVKFSLGTPPTRTVTGGPRRGEVVPRHEVVLPGWDDILHVQPTASLTKEERADRRDRMFRSLKSSPTPEVIRNFSQIGQEIDNVQDAMVTLSVAGRIVTKLTGRAIPGVGTISTIADALNVLNIFYPKTARQAVTGAVTRTGARLSGRKKYLASRELKRTLGLKSRADLSTYLRRLEETVKTGKVGFGFGEALQVLQTSDELTGFGVSLGPIFGALQDSFFGFLRGARFDLSGPMGLTSAERTPEELEAMRKFAPGAYDLVKERDPAVRRRIAIDWPGLFPTIDKLYGNPTGTFERDVEVALDPVRKPAEKAVLATLNAIGATQKAVVSAAAKVWDAGRWIAGLRGDLSWEDHVELLCAQWLALDVYEPYLQQSDWGAVAAGLVSNPLPGGDRSSAGLYGGKNLGEMCHRLVFGPGREKFDWVDEAPTAEAREFTVALIEGFAEKFLFAIEGPYARIAEQSSVGFRAVHMLHDYDLLPPYDRSDEETARFVAGAIALVEGSAEGVPAYGAVRELWLSSFPGGDLSA